MAARVSPTGSCRGGVRWLAARRTSQGSVGGLPFDRSRVERGGIQVAIGEPEDLQAHVVVLVRLPDPLHADTARCPRAAIVAGSHHGTDVLLAVAERIVRPGVNGRGRSVGSAVPDSWRYSRRSRPGSSAGQRSGPWPATAIERPFGCRGRRARLPRQPAPTY